MARWLEAASGALTLLAFWAVFPRFSDLGAIEGIPGAIVTSPSPLTVPANAAIGTVVGTLSVAGGSGSYTYTLPYDQLGYFTIVGNQLQVNSSSMVAGTDNIVIQANGSGGDVIQLPTYVIITPVGYIPTYPYYGF